VPPALKSGIILTYPLDLGGEYTVKVGDITEKCKASSTAELTCITLPIFHAVVASRDCMNSSSAVSPRTMKTTIGHV